MISAPEPDDSNQLDRAFVEELYGYVRVQSIVSAQLREAMTQAAVSTEALAGSIRGGFGDAGTMLLRLDTLGRQCGRMSQAAARTLQSADETYEAGFSCARGVQSAIQGSSTAVDHLAAIQGSLRTLQEKAADSEVRARALANALTALVALAQQANLLAINANIETARAGERGAGFGSVVRQMALLAQATGEAAKQIGLLAQEVVRRSRGTAPGLTRAASDVTTALGVAARLQETALSLDGGARVMLQSAQNNCSAARMEERAAARLQETLAQARQEVQDIMKAESALETLVWQQRAAAKVLSRQIPPVEELALRADTLVQGMLTEPRPEDVYRVAVDRKPAAIDPAYAQDLASMQLIHLVFSGLVRRGFDGMFSPSLASSWSLCDGGQTAVFRLRPNVLFHHGLALEARDVIESIERVISPGTSSPNRSLFGMVRGAEDFRRGDAGEVRGIRIADDGEVTFTFDGPLESLLSALAHPAAGVIGARDPIPAGQPFPGTGPFKYAGWSEEGLCVLEAFQDYFEGRPFADRVEFRVIESHQDRRRAFDQGALSHVELDAEMIASAQRDEALMERLLLSPENPECGVMVGEGVRGLALEPGGLFDLRRVWMRTKREF